MIFQSSLLDPANVYGPGQQLFRIIPRTIISCKTKVKMQLHGGGGSIRSFIHIKDVVSATLTLGLKAENGSTWHLSTENAISIKELVSTICNITNTNFEEIVEISKERLGKDQTYLLNSDAMRESFGWKDKIGLKKVYLIPFLGRIKYRCYKNVKLGIST